METPAAKIIDALGGTSAVSRITEAPISTVHSWRKNGIPRSRMAHLRLIAERDGIEITGDTGERADHADPDTAPTPCDASGKGDDVSAQAVSV